METKGKQKIWTDTDGVAVEIYESVGATWIRVNGKQRGSGTSFGSTSTIEPVSRREYLDGLAKFGKNPTDYREVAGVLVRAAAVPFIEAVLAEMRAEESKAREDLLRNVPGLAALRAARNDEERYGQEFEEMMDDEDNDGVRPPKPVRIAASEVAATYPVAAAYLKAEAWEGASNYGKSGAGSKAKERIAAGEDCNRVLREMEAEWAAAAANVWD